MRFKNKRRPKKGADIGFFVMLGICMIAIMVVAYVTVFSDLGIDEPDIDNTDDTVQTPQDDTPVITAPEDDSDDEKDDGKQDDIKDNEDNEDNEGSDKDTEPVVAIPEEKNVTYSYPLIGDISKEYVVDSVVFSASLNDWRTHKGIDIMGDENAKVYASADGVVEDVYFDELMGNTVVILHEDGIRTVYSNLEENVLVKAGQQVTTKSAIGIIGNTSSAECMDVPHVHFEIIKNGEQLDPETLLN